MSSYADNTEERAQYEDFTNELDESGVLPEDERSDMPNEKNSKSDDSGRKLKKLDLKNLDDRDKFRFVGASAYLLFFIPLIWARDDEISRFHASQGLLVHLVEIAAGVGGGMLQILAVALQSTLLAVVFGFLRLVLAGAAIALMCCGIASAMSEKNTPLPIIGGIEIFH